MADPKPFDAFNRFVLDHKHVFPLVASAGVILVVLGVGASVGLMAVYSKWDETALLSLTGIGLGGAAVFAVFLGLLAVTHQVRDISPQLELEIHIFRTPKLLTDRGVVQDIVHYQTSLINTGEEDARDLELSWD